MPTRAPTPLSFASHSPEEVKEAVSPTPPALLAGSGTPRRVTGGSPAPGLFRGPGPRRGGSGLGWGPGSLALSGPRQPPLLPSAEVLIQRDPVLGPYYKTSTVTAFRWVLGGAGGRWAAGGRAGCGAAGVMRPRGPA